LGRREERSQIDEKRLLLHLLGRREERSQNAELKFLHLRLRPQVLMIQLFCLVAKFPHLRPHPMQLLCRSLEWRARFVERTSQLLMMTKLSLWML